MRINKSEFVISQSNVESKYYTKKGYEDYLDENDFPRLKVESSQTFAKAVKEKPNKKFNIAKNLSYSFYIKADPNKNLYNPIELHSIEPKIKSSFINKICKSELVFIQVPESVFNKYLNFLKTESTKWLSEAQREIR